MAKKPITANMSKAAAAKTAEPKAPARAPLTTSTPVRATPIPKTPTPKPAVTHEMISRRAYEIWQSGTGGSEYDNWVRAERELRGA